MSLHFHTSLKRTSSLLERSLSLIRAVNTSYFQITDSLSLFLIAGIAVRPIYSNSFPLFSLLTLYKSTRICVVPWSADGAPLFHSAGGHTHTHTLHTFGVKGGKKKGRRKPCVVDSTRD